jgi:hypothetical protein
MALMGLTLLECGTPASDADLQKAATVVRAAAPRLAHTYSLATVILFLERLGDERDTELIQLLGLRLMAGQTGVGSWDYLCPLLGREEEQALLRYLKSYPAEASEPPKDLAGLPGRLPSLPVLLGPSRQSAQMGYGGGDNSNAQFAVLALWVAQRRGLNVRPAMVLADRHFRQTQHGNGSWGYVGRDTSRPASMTCAGLLALAVARSVSAKAQGGGGPERDEAIEKGFTFLAEHVGSDARRGSSEGGRIIQAASWGDLYYLWSLERVAMVYNLKAIKGKDWYAWASKVIVAAQQADGSWHDAFAGPADTCFALLVLHRVNVAKDLTDSVKRVISIKDIEGAGNR